MRVDKKLLFPLFALQLIEFESRLKAAGLPFYAFMGLRSWEEQNELYAQGRTKPGKIVTNARAGSSWHNYGLAVDYVLDGQIEKPGIQWSWETKNVDFNKDGHNDWKQMGEVVVASGLEWGGSENFRDSKGRRMYDLPHVQNRYGLTINTARTLYNRGGLIAVWNECSGYYLGGQNG